MPINPFQYQRHDILHFTAYCTLLSIVLTYWDFFDSISIISLLRYHITPITFSYIRKARRTVYYDTILDHIILVWCHVTSYWLHMSLILYQIIYVYRVLYSLSSMKVIWSHMSYFISSNALSLSRERHRTAREMDKTLFKKILEAQTSSSNKSMDTWQLWAG